MDDDCTWDILGVGWVAGWVVASMMDGWMDFAFLHVIFPGRWLSEWVDEWMGSLMLLL